MNITWLRLKPLIRELQGIREQLERMNDIREAELAYNGLHIRPPVADTSGSEPETLYTDEESDFYRELAEEMGKVGRKRDDEPVE